jgi:hypothetical protein
MTNRECATPQKYFDLRFLGYSRELSAQYLGLRPDCEGVRHWLRFLAGQVFPSSAKQACAGRCGRGYPAFADCGSLEFWDSNGGSFSGGNNGHAESAVAVVRDPGEDR